jgi:hypothetical protein
MIQAWAAWKEYRAVELIDSNIGETYIESEVLRCMHISLLCVQENPHDSLLCVQENPHDRLTMASVILMLGSTEMELGAPKGPGFIYKNVLAESNLQANQKDCSSANEVTISLLDAR